MKRRSFLKYSSFTGIGMVGLGTMACKSANPKDQSKDESQINSEEALYKISLAQWSFNRAIRDGTLDPFDFATKAKEMGFEGIEYVNGLYREHYLESENMLGAIKSMGEKMKMKAEEADIPSLLIMIDGEPPMGTQDLKIRKEAIASHHKWVDLADFLGCHSIRINLAGRWESRSSNCRLFREYGCAV